MFMVATKSINSSDVTIRVPDVPNSGKANQYQSKPVIIDKDGKGNYTGTVTKTYEMRGTKFSSAHIKVNAKVYTGKAVKIEPKDIV